MRYKIFSIIIISILSILFFTCSRKKIGETDLFVNIDSHGIAIDDSNNMYAASKGKTIYKIKPNKKYAKFIKLDDEKFKDTHIWSMKIGKDNNLYCAAQNSILKVNPEGEVITLVKKETFSRAGIAGLDFDKSGNIYYSNSGDNKIYMIYQDNNKLNNELSGIKNENDNRLNFLIGVKFDNNYNYMYVASFTGGYILKYPFLGVNSFGEPEYINSSGNVQYLEIDKNGKIYGSIVQEKALFTIKDGKEEVISLGFKPKTKITEIDAFYFNAIALGKNEFKDDYLYTSGSKGIFKVYIGKNR